MKIIYDSEEVPHRRVTLNDDAGTTHVCGCFDIKIEITNPSDSNYNRGFTMKRWGKASERSEKHKEVRSKLDTENEVPK
ncbi:hypothetical protein CH380_19265 [Leptospira adleri]|uniref:Uncharacterized protein n=1 Tax=Leptospira adleri TaxID=2023186 RepID=A0A2M9YJ74_9LEPT|nr:hypothetical protein CH380_19265 [Leptospira adleri]PJZ61904.1 hypothetical protein CH376_10900 [Leptospira adleri]